MRVLYLSPVPIDGAGTRYRIAQYFPKLRDSGVEASVAAFYSRQSFAMAYGAHLSPAKFVFLVADALRRLAVIARSRAFDLVVVYREAFPIGPAVLERCFPLQRIPMVYDFDDAVYLPNVSEANRTFAWLKQPEKTRALITMSSRVLAGNAFLARYARKLNHCVELMPTVVDTQYFSPSRGTNNSTVVVGWMGSHTTEPHFAQALPVLHKLQQRYPHVAVRMVSGDSAKQFEGVERRHWTLQDELAELQAFDIGIMPLPSDEWSEGKCGLKALQYMSVGKPVVCSVTEANQEIVQHDESGFLATTETEWLEALSRLVEDGALRHRMGAAARARVVDLFSLQRWAPRYVAAILDAAPSV